MSDKHYIGIDVSKQWLDVGRHDAAAVIRLPNTEAAIAGWLAGLDPEQVGLICYEPTGGYERVLQRLLQPSGLRFMRVHPNQVAAFRQLRGVKAKTDAQDARLLAAFAASPAPRGHTPCPEADETLRALSVRRVQVLAMQHAERCRAAQSDSAAVRASIAAVCKTLGESLRATEAAIAQHIATTPTLRERGRLLRTLKGIGPVSVHTLLAELPELGRLSGKQIASLVGLAPRTNDSGLRRGRAAIGYGRPGVRRGLFNAARIAIRHNPLMRAFYQRLVHENGRPGKVALVAVMRKMLVILNAMVRENAPWGGATEAIKSSFLGSVESAVPSSRPQFHAAARAAGVKDGPARGATAVRRRTACLTPASTRPRSVSRAPQPPPHASKVG